MTSDVVFDRNRATADEIATHLARNDDAYVPRLSERVDIPAYAARILDHGERFEAWADDRLVGLVAAYGDDHARSAFITNVSIDAPFRHRGLAGAMMDVFFEDAVARRLASVTLEVDQDNRAAISLYQRLGFSVLESTGRTIRMAREVRNEDEERNLS